MWIVWLIKLVLKLKQIWELHLEVKKLLKGTASLEAKFTKELTITRSTTTTDINETTVEQVVKILLIPKTLLGQNML